jgi:insulin-like growth factor 2 receptor
MNTSAVTVALGFVCVLEGDNCQVKDPRHGNLYDLRPLALNTTTVSAGEYTYYFRICGKLSADVCSSLDRSKAVSSCQEKRGPQGFQKVAGTMIFLLLYDQNIKMLGGRSRFSVVGRMGKTTR